MCHFYYYLQWHVRYWNWNVYHSYFIYWNISKCSIRLDSLGKYGFPLYILKISQTYYNWNTISLMYNKILIVKYSVHSSHHSYTGKQKMLDYRLWAIIAGGAFSVVVCMLQLICNFVDYYYCLYRHFNSHTGTKRNVLLLYCVSNNSWKVCFHSWYVFIKIFFKYYFFIKDTHHI